MRLYSMYFICKNSLDSVLQIKTEHTKIRSDIFVDRMLNWHSKAALLDQLAIIPALKQAASDLYEIIPVIQRSKDSFDLTVVQKGEVDRYREALVNRMKAIIDLYEDSILPDVEGNGFDICMPNFTAFSELSECVKDLEFIIYQCPYLNRENAEIKYRSANIGSFWFTFFIAGASASTVLISLSKVVEAAIKAKSHIVTVKQQEEVLRSMQQKNNIAAEIIDTFKQVNKEIIGQRVNELEGELGELKDGEERSKVERSIEKMAYWISKGMMIYSAIDAPKEVKVLFPEQADQGILGDDIIKLLEMKSMGTVDE